MMIRKNLFVIAAMCVCMACGNQRSEEMEADFNMDEHSKAHGASSDDLAAGRGDTTLHDGATHGGEQGAINHENTEAAAPVTNTAQPAMSDANILAKMSITDTKEVAEGKLGAQKAKNADVKKFAQMLVTHHTKMLNDGKATAQKLAVTPVPMPNSPDSAMAAASMQRLSSMPAERFDNEFMIAQIEGHQMALNDLNTMLNATQNAGVKTLIQNAIPVVTSHLEQARTLQRKLMGAAENTTGAGTSTTTTKKGQ